MNKNQKFTQTLSQAKKLFKLKTGIKYKRGSSERPRGIRIFTLKIARTKTRRYLVGTEFDWLAL